MPKRGELSARALCVCSLWIQASSGCAFQENAKLAPDAGARSNSQRDGYPDPSDSREVRGATVVAGWPDASEAHDAGEREDSHDAAASRTTPALDGGEAPVGAADAGLGMTVFIEEDGTPLMIEHGPAGAPAAIGCADGRREGLFDMRLYPNIAACLGAWNGAQNLRSDRSGAPCGNDRGPCANPADICAQGWHICGVSGALFEVARLSAGACAMAGGGRYVAAISHCLLQSGCSYDTSTYAIYPCFASGWCAEPVCCGLACTGIGACTDGVWPRSTRIPLGTNQGCARITSARAGGVLCCID